MADLSPAHAALKKTMLKHIVEFNSTLRKLTLQLTTQFPNDAATARAQKRIMAAIDHFPMWVVDEVGRGLFKYREQIEAEDADFFLKNDYDEERQKAAEEDPEKAALTDHLIPKVKDAWGAADGATRQKLIEMSQDLLDAYIDYLTTKRQLGD